MCEELWVHKLWVSPRPLKHINNREMFQLMLLSLVCVLPHNSVCAACFSFCRGALKIKRATEQDHPLSVGTAVNSCRTKQLSKMPSSPRAQEAHQSGLWASFTLVLSMAQ